MNSELIAEGKTSGGKIVKIGIGIGIEKGLDWVGSGVEKTSGAKTLFVG